jgi:FtsH-binding integral membrane protein
MNTYVDALAALVPAEVLTLHGLILSVTTQAQNSITKIIAPETLFWAFFGLIVMSVGLYVVPRLLTAKEWDSLDWLRAAIPPLAFIGWTMLQRATAFDAVFPRMCDPLRTVIALFLGAVLGVGATALAYKADQKEP